MASKLEVLKKVTSRVADKPPLRNLLERYYERRFLGSPGMFRGVYGSFAEAARAAPKHAKLGYDHPELTKLYADRHFMVLPSDYPVLFWLDRILRTARSVFDFGGHLGVQFYSYSKYLAYPEGLRWTVLDVPEIVRRGRELAEERGRRDIEFTTDFALAADHDVLFASGSLQYVETPFAKQLEGLSKLPPAIVVNKMPLQDGPAFVTLQNVQYSYSPYAISNRRDFVESVTRLGYELVDSWETPDMHCELPLTPERSIRAYTGLYFRRR